ncbi:MAG: CgeB family protein [Terriglobales bacterium]
MHWVFFGLSLTSSWGNGHATTYRGLLRGLRDLGHTIDFFEKDVPWYATQRDLPRPREATLHLYSDWPSVRPTVLALLARADAVLVGSYFPDAVALLDDALSGPHPPICFYDIDTPVTLATVASGTCGYLRRDLIGKVDLYLSFTGGPVLQELRERWGARAVAPLYCACDPNDYPRAAARRVQPPVLLSYMGTFAPDRQSKLQRYLLEPARQLPRAVFAVAGSMYPSVSTWPANVTYYHHLAPEKHAGFYLNSCFTLNLTRQAMVEAGYSPSIRLFEAACTATAVISDPWPGLEEFFAPGREILVAADTGEMLDILQRTPLERARQIGAAARRRVLARHTGRHRAAELLAYRDEICCYGKLLQLHQSVVSKSTASALAPASFHLTDERAN